MCPAAPLPASAFPERALAPLPGQPFTGTGVLWGRADLHAGPDAGSSMVETSDDVATGVSGLFRARYPEMVRLADLLGADDPEDIAPEAFARPIRKHGSLRNPEAALAYVRASVCNLTRKPARFSDGAVIVFRNASGTELGHLT